MNKILLIIPSILIFIFIWIDSIFSESKYILLGIYIIFPMIFVVQGIIYSKSIKSMVVGCTLSSMAVLIPISIWYNMTSMLIPVIIYLLLAICVFVIKQNKNKVK